MNSLKPNKLLSLVNRINTTVPQFLRSTVLSLAFNSQIKYAGTTGIAIQKWTPQEAVVTLKNRGRVQNHLKGVHATAMATLAESATGMVFGVHVPDSHLPVLKSLNVSYKKLAKGNLQAVASISPDQIEEITTMDKGSTVVQVTVTDEDGKEPISCEMEWAWTTKRRKEKNAPAV